MGSAPLIRPLLLDLPSFIQMATLVFDIETAALPLESFDEMQREYLFREAARLTDQSAREKREQELGEQLSLYPVTARVLCIAMLNAETARGQVLFTAEDYEPESDEEAEVQFIPCVSEDEMLAAFWDVARHYESVATFNGRCFDVPFIYLRSAILNVPITRKDWLGYRYQTVPHCDLAEQLTFYCVSGRDGAARRFNLDFYCKVFGIPSPKTAEVNGSSIRSLLDAGADRQIAEYCLRDVKATVQLYHIWRERLAGIK